MEFHETSLVLKYVFGCSRVLNPLRKRISKHTLTLGILMGKGYLARLGTIPSVMPFPAIVITLHTYYILVFIVLSLLLLGHTFPKLRALRGLLTFLGQFSTRGPFAFRLMSLGN